MNKEYHKVPSAILGQDISINVYGSGGRPCIVFPSSEGHYQDFENWGMVEVCKDFIEKKQIQLFCVDAIDEQSLFNKTNHIGDRAWRQRQEPLMATGCSWGAYHSVNFIVKYPDVFDTIIALSGVYSLGFLFGDYCDENVYHSDPLKYLPGLNDEKTIEQLKKHTIIIAVGQGAWEAESIHDSKAVAAHLRSKGIKLWLDVWGEDVAHDWCWWRKMLPYHLEKLFSNNVPKE